MDLQQIIIDFFQLPPTITEIVIFGLIALAFCYQLYYYIRYMAGVNRRLRKINKGKYQLSTHQPPVSIIICARNEEENLRTFLPSILTQEYPEYEVIVVDDSSEDSTRSYLQQMATLNKRLRYTFVPKGPYQFSTKKLAITLGVKAAKYEHLLLTDADCRPDGPQWIAAMMRGYNDNIDIVLGFGAYEKANSHVNRLIAYDTLWNGMQFLGHAASRHPYMGVGRNLSYKKSLFFANKGFAQFLNVRAGDDDLFVNYIATGKNTNIAVQPEAITWSIPKTTLGDWLDQKRRHIGVSAYYRFGTKCRLLFEPLSRGIFYLGIILVCIFCRPYVWASALLLMLIRFIWQICIINVTAKKLHQKRFHINIIWFDIILPLVNLFMITVTTISPRKRNIW